MNKSPIIIALDYGNPQHAHALLDKLDAQSCRVKIGKELFCRGGPAFVDKVVKSGFDVFLDLKFHDIPNTVANACAAAADLGVWMINVHALGGVKMMQAARTALQPYPKPPLLIAVTILTSLSGDDLHEIGLSGEPVHNVQRLAALAHRAGMDGIVCSPLEAASVRESEGEHFCLVTPGVRPRGSSEDDQKRITTPAQALQYGANYLVIGRPITGAAQPSEALNKIQAEIDAVTQQRVK